MPSESEVQKAQWIRLIDVFVLGPFLIIAAGKQRNAYFKIGLALSGIATILYNGQNYLRISRGE